MGTPDAAGLIDWNNKGNALIVRDPKALEAAHILGQHFNHNSVRPAYLFIDHDLYSNDYHSGMLLFDSSTITALTRFAVPTIFSANNF